MVKRGEHFIPDIIVIGEGKATNIIIKGMEFGNCISDFEYSARNKNGDLNPTVNLIGVCVDKFEPRDGSDTFARLQRMFEKKEAEADGTATTKDGNHENSSAEKRFEELEEEISTLRAAVSNLQRLARWGTPEQYKLACGHCVSHNHIVRYDMQ